MGFRPRGVGFNAAAVDLFTKSILVNNEDGHLYRWDLGSNILSQAVDMSAGSYQTYTPTVIGMDGIVYGINNARLYAVGR